MVNKLNTLGYNNLRTESLLKLYIDGSNLEVKQIIIYRNLEIVNSIISKYSDALIDLADLYSHCIKGINEYIDEYIYNDGLEFEHYVTKKTILKVKEYFKESSKTMNYKSRVYELDRNIKNSINMYKVQNKQSPKVIDISRVLGCNEEMILQVLELANINKK